MKTEVKQRQQQRQQQQQKEHQPRWCNNIPNRKTTQASSTTTFQTKSSSTTSTAAPPALVPTVKPKKSCTAFLCELTRLKSQQKYLECNQFKLIPSHFEDEDDGVNNVAPPVAAAAVDVVANVSSSIECITKTSVRQFIADIEQLKLVLENDLNEYRIAAKREVEDMWIFVNAIKEDVFQPARLQRSSVIALRERIIGINSQLNRLNAKNAKELSDLQKDYERMHNETKLLIK